MGASMGQREGTDDRAVEDMTYTEASTELDEIVSFFEGRDVDVDQLVGRLVRATAIIEELDKRLRRTRVQVEQLVPRLSAVLDGAADDDGGDPAGDDVEEVIAQDELSEDGEVDDVEGERPPELF